MRVCEMVDGERNIELLIHIPERLSRSADLEFCLVCSRGVMHGKWSHHEM
jgi:hypothetical protein